MNDRIKKLRRELELTQQEFANKIGIKRNTIATYESGRNDPIDAVISLVCREFNVNETWLRTGEGNMFIEVPEEDEVMKYMALLLKDENDIVTKAVTGFVLAYGKLNPANKSIIQTLLKETLTHLTQ